MSYRHIADTRVAHDDEIKSTLTLTDSGIAFDFYEDLGEDDPRTSEAIDSVEVPFTVLADMARQYLRGESWVCCSPERRRNEP